MFKHTLILCLIDGILYWCLGRKGKEDMYTAKSFDFSKSKGTSLVMAPGVKAMDVYRACVARSFNRTEVVGYFIDEKSAYQAVKGKGPWGGGGSVYKDMVLFCESNQSFWLWINSGRVKGPFAIDVYESYEEYLDRFVALSKRIKKS